MGDFGKYGLLRAVCRNDEHGPALRLGVLWYLFDGCDSGAPNDGRHTQYLCSPSRHEKSLRNCDPELFDRIRKLVKRKHRSVAVVESLRILPEDTVFFSDGLNFDSTPFRERCAKRRDWLKAGLDRVKEAEITFFDPDNGLEVPSRGRHSLKGPKYVYYEDLRPCWENGQSLIVYHHSGRTYNGIGANLKTQVSGRLNDLASRLPDSEPMALIYRRRSSRVYFVLPNSAHAHRIGSRIKQFLKSPWGQGSSSHFELVC